MAKSVAVIPAKPTFEIRGLQQTVKLRVCAYCRVSTDSEEQLTSYQAQMQHYLEYISQNPSWEFSGIYADEGISGTSTKNRTQFNKLIKDCKDRKVDLVLTKSISRFARNTLDCLKYIRLLKEYGVAVFFEKENVNTLDSKGEFLLTL
ncbi:MAG: recombinase family protein, partial [Anaerovoracaceae bacterium]